MFERIDYRVNRIDGDYAYLVQCEGDSQEEKCVARALLPDGVNEGSLVAYEMMSYSLI